MYNAQNHLHESSKVRGLDMGQDYTGANYFDGGSVASFGDPQLSTKLFYDNQSQSQNRGAEVSAKTVEAARNADLDILSASQQKKVANDGLQQNLASLIQQEGMESAGLRALADPSRANKIYQDVAAINLQGKAIRQNQMFA